MSLIKITASGATSQPFCQRQSAEADSAYERARQYLYVDEREACHVGVSGRIDAACDFAAFPECELTVVVAGELRITDASQRVMVAGAGEAVVIPRGLRCSIDQSRLERRVFVAVGGGEVGSMAADRVVKIDPHAPMSECPFALATTLLTSKETPVSTVQTSFEDPGLGFSAGLWGCTPYTRLPITIARNEFMQMLEGSCVLVASDGVRTTASAGDMVFIPRGSVFDWHSPVNVVKLYGSHR